MQNVTDTSGAQTKKPAPVFKGRRLLVVGSASIGVMHLPFWLNWVQTNYPDVELRVALTRGAEQFVSVTGLSALINRNVDRDVWIDGTSPGAPHVRLAQWPDAVAVYPASLSFVTSLALGMVGGPILMALQCTAAPIALAPSLPPGSLDNPVVADHLKALSARPNIAVAPTVPKRSASDGDLDANAAAPMWTVLELLGQLRGDDTPAGQP